MDIPIGVALGIFSVCIGLGIVAAVILGVRATRGMRGESSRRGMLYGFSWWFSFMCIAGLSIQLGKADIDPDAATRARAQINASLRLLGMHGSPDQHAQSAAATFWSPKVIQLSALHGTGVDTFWNAVTEFQNLSQANGKLEQRRQSQALAWMWERIDAGLKQAFKQNPAVQASLPEMTRAVAAGQLAASTAARNLLAALANTESIAI